MGKEIFVGRRVILREFKESLMGLLADPKDQKSQKVRKKNQEENGLQPRFFLLHGKDGLGKTSLVSQMASVVDKVADDSKKSIKQIHFDFNAPLFAKSSIAPDADEIVRYIYSIVGDDALSIAEKFTEYESVARRLNHIREKTASFFALEAKPEAVRTAASHNAEAIAAPPLAPVDTYSAQAAILRRLKEQKSLPDEDVDLFENAAARSVKAIVNGLMGLSTEMVTVILIDNLEKLGTKENIDWFRSAFLAKLFERVGKIIVICAGSETVIRDFRNTFDDELLYHFSCENETLTIRDIEEWAQALRVTADGAQIESVSGGIPLIVRDILSIAKDGKPIAEFLALLGSKPGLENGINAIVDNFLSMPIDKANLSHIVHCALLHEYDSKVIASLWNCAYADVGAEISELSDHYPFFTDRILHPAVRQRIRTLCMEGYSEDLKKIVVEFSEHTTALFAEELKQLSIAVPAIDKRYSDERFARAFIGYLSSLLWTRQDDVRRVIPGCFCECLLYNPMLAGKILGVINEFVLVLPPDHVSFYKTLSSGLLEAVRRPLWQAILPQANERSLLSVLEASIDLLSKPQAALLHLYRASMVVGLAEFENAFDDLEQCEAFADESDTFAETLAKGFLSVGNAFFNADRYDNAIMAYGRVAEIRPGLFDAWYGLGRCHALLLRHVQAQDAFAKAAALKPDRWDLHAALGREQFACGSFAAAQASYQRAADLFEGSAEVFAGLGKSLKEQEKFDEAIRALARANELRPDDAELWYEKGYCQAARDWHHEAIDSARKALAIRSDYWEASMLVGQELFALRSYADSVKAFEDAAVINDSDPQLHYTLGHAALLAQDTAKAITAFTKATELKDDFSEAYNGLGMAYSAANRIDDAVLAYEKAIINNPQYAEAFNNLGNAHFLCNRYAQALDSYVKATNAKPDFSEAWYNTGLSLHALSRYEEAIAPYEKALALEPQRFDIWFNKAIAFVAIDRPEQAIESFKKTVELSPDHYEAYFKMGQAYLQIGNNRDADAAFSRATQIAPDKEDAWRLLGTAQSRSDKFEQAIFAFEKAVALVPSQYDAWFGLGAAYKETAKYEEAYKAFCEALKSQNTLEGWFNAGQCSYYLNEYNEAIELLSHAIEMKSDHKESLYTTALSMHALGRFEDAAKLYRRTLEIEPENSNAKMNYALCLHALGKHADAIEIYSAIVEAQPQNGEAWFNLARAQEALGNVSEALKAYLKTVDITPDRVAAWASMGNLQMAQEQYADAITLFSEVVKVTEHDVEAWSNIALASYYLGKYAESVEAYSKALSASPDDAMLLGSLGLTYYAMGDYAKAIEESEKALAKKPDELWIEVNVGLAAIILQDFEKAAKAFDNVIALAASAHDLLHPIAVISEMVNRTPDSIQAKDILLKLQDAWQKLKALKP